jgi:hypothetical protein
MREHVRLAIDDMRAAYRTFRSYRWVVVMLIALTLVSLIIGLAAGLSNGGSVTGDAIFVLVSVTITGLIVGIVSWGIAAVWYRRPAP